MFLARFSLQKAAQQEGRDLAGRGGGTLAVLGGEGRRQGSRLLLLPWWASCKQLVACGRTLLPPPLPHRRTPQDVSP